MMKSENGEHCFSVQYQHSGAPVYVCTLYCVHAVLTGQVCLEDVYIDIHIRRSSIQLRHSAFNMSTLVCMASHVTDMFHHSTESPCTCIHTYHLVRQPLFQCCSVRSCGTLSVTEHVGSSKYICTYILWVSCETAQHTYIHTLPLSLQIPSLDRRFTCVQG